MNKTPKAKSKSKSKTKNKPKGKPICPSKPHHKSSHRGKDINVKLMNSPKTMNYSKVLKKYGDIIEDSTNSNCNSNNNTKIDLELKKEAFISKRKVSYDIDSNDKSYSSSKETQSKVNSAMSPSFKQRTPSTTPNRDDNEYSPEFKEGIEDDQYGEQEQDQYSNNIDSRDKPNSLMMTNHTTFTSKTKRDTFNSNMIMTNNKTNDEQLSEKVGIMLKLFHKYSLKLYQLINSCNTSNESLMQPELLKELELTIKNLHKTVTNDKLYSMFSIKQSKINTEEEEKNSNSIRDLNENIKKMESVIKENKIQIVKYENEIKKLKDNTIKLKQTINTFERNESETIKHYKETSESALNENMKLKAKTEELKQTIKEQQNKIKAQLEYEAQYKSQSEVISKLENKISSLETEITFKETTISDLEKNIQRLKIYPIASNTISSNTKTLQMNLIQSFTLPKAESICKESRPEMNMNIVSSNQSSSVLHNKDIHQSDEEYPLTMYGSRNWMEINRLNNEDHKINIGNMNSNTNSNQQIINSDDLEKYLTNNLNKQLDNNSDGIISQESNNYHNNKYLSNISIEDNDNNNTHVVNYKQPDTLQKEIDVLDKEIYSLKNKLKTMISLNNKK